MQRFFLWKRSHWVQVTGIAFAASLGVVSPLVAQQGTEEAASKDEWVISYFLVILCVGLGLFVICRPGRRSKKVKAE